MKKTQITISTEMITDVLLGRQNQQNSNISVTGFALRDDGVVVIDLEGDGLPDECENENVGVRLVINKEVIMVDKKPLQIITHEILAKA